jgi:hypothetical protein
MLNARPTWAVSVRCTSRETKLLVTELGNDLLKARLDPHPRHPRALMTLCEGLALWHGSPLRVAVSAADDAMDCFERIFYGGDLVEPISALVLLEAHLRRERRHGLGLGDFRAMRLRLVKDDR